MKFKLIPAKQIIMTKPKQRYVIDLTYIPTILSGKTGFNYILNILGHFNKFLCHN